MTPQSEDFSAWYNELVIKAELVDRGPVRGTMVIRPYGYRIWELLQADLDRRIKETGHENAYFPLLIPQSYLQREAEHVEGFAPELAVVTHAGGKELEEPLVVRPTSETVIGEFMAKWISSHRDLPMLLNQWANVVRWELRPRMFLRTTEFLWQEGHTAHADEADAMRRDHAGAATIYARTRPRAGRDAGHRRARRRRASGSPAPVRTFTHRGDDAGRPGAAGRHVALPGDQLRRRRSTSSTPARTASSRYAHTTSWGMTTRMIGGVIMTHGDDKGLVLPPRLAPYQVVIVPIGRGEPGGEVTAAAAGAGRAAGRRGHPRPTSTTGRTLSPGLQVQRLGAARGPDPARARARATWPRARAVMVQRLGEGKEPISLDGAPARLADELDRVPGPAARAGHRLPRPAHGHHRRVGRLRQGGRHRLGPGAALRHAASARRRSRPRPAATARCIPLDGEPESGPCIRCGLPSAYGKRVIFGRAY